MALTFISLASGAYLLLPNQVSTPQAQSPAPVVQNLPWSNIATNTTISQPQSQTKPQIQTLANTSPKTTDTSPAPTSNSPVIPTPITATISINGQAYSLNLPEKSTAYDAMVQLVAEKKITIVFKEFSGLGYFVDEVDGIKTDKNAGKYWIYHLNGKPAQMGISNYILKNNDSITWKYEVPQF